MNKINFVSFGIIFDDIVTPEGHSHMKVLGGGGPQTAFGMRLWSSEVGLVAGVNQTDREFIYEWLSTSDIDRRGIRTSNLPTPRAWQLLEADGRRTQVWRVSQETIQNHLHRSLDYLPEDYRGASGFHFGIHPEEPGLEFMASLHELGAIVSIEPFKPADKVPTPLELRNLLSYVDIFSANQLEAFSLVSIENPKEQALRLAESGARVVVIRLGAGGSLVLDSLRGKWARVPAVPIQVFDPVGAGNAYCGGFLVGWSQSHDVKIAGTYAAVAASFMIEQVGVPSWRPELDIIKGQRLQMIAPMVEDLTI
ncbi:MAG: carbohydrate kinase family protein [Anaerolineales bacterium]|nr:carbohydrate kinase family protein [Anaerolineales bacterium]